jgi:2-C-methyl-D-erythritol 4-phosphate cytidylyltransferase / 2-C-methyl-D-erythritol 2,4-cyclodiphosphate synthase
MEQNIKHIALIVAAGSGVRTGFAVPKQYVLLNHKMVLTHTIEKFLADKRFDGVQIVINPAHHDLYTQSINAISNDKILPVIFGGHTRQESVFCGLTGIYDYNPDYVFIHDAARPFISSDIIDALFDALPEYDGAVPAVAVTDSLRYISPNGIFENSVEREHLMAVQTPQAFDYKKILYAHRHAHTHHISHHTDDISVGLSQGLKIKSVSGQDKNMKLTYPSDFKSDFKNELPDIRVASGYDVHRLIAGDGVILGGVHIPCDYKLLGHSDADVVLHAVTDAVLGACGQQDIGHHFSPQNPQWAGADSAMFMRHAVDLLRQSNGRLNYIDVTIICEVPKISPYREKIRESIAHLCDMPIAKISIKATTTEKLGFTGRGEGIAAQAVTTCYFDSASF